MMFSSYSTNLPKHCILVCVCVVVCGGVWWCVCVCVYVCLHVFMCVLGFLVGQEGPLVYIGGVIGAGISQV